MQLKTNDWLAQENAMFEEYLRRVYPNIDSLAAADKGSSKSRKKTEALHESFNQLSADEKSNICSHQIDAVLSALSDVEQKGQDELSEVRAHSTATRFAAQSCRCGQRTGLPS